MEKLSWRPFTAMFSGPEQTAEREEDLRAALCREIARLVEREGYRVFLCGGAPGFDTLAAQTLLDLRGRRRDFLLYIVLPCGDYGGLLTKDEDSRLRSIALAADHVLLASPGPYSFERVVHTDRYMVRRSSVLLTCAPEAGGRRQSFYTAKREGLQIVTLP